LQFTIAIKKFENDEQITKEEEDVVSHLIGKKKTVSGKFQKKKKYEV
jgi:hypothetical protein